MPLGPGLGIWALTTRMPANVPSGPHEDVLPVCLFVREFAASGARRLPFVALSPGIRAATIMATALVVLAGGSPAEAAGAPGGRQPGLPGTARADFVPALLARGSPDVVYLLGTAWGTSPARVELLRSSDDGEHFQAVTAPPGTAPSAGAPLGDIEHLSFVSPEEGFVVRVGRGGRLPRPDFSGRDRRRGGVLAPGRPPG